MLAELSEGAVVLADKAYDADAIRALIEAQGAAPNIPARSTRKARFCFSRSALQGTQPDRALVQ